MSSGNKRPLGIPPTVLATFGISLLTTVAIALYQLHLRNDDEGRENIFYFLYMMQDYPAALLAILIMIVSLHPALQRAGLAVLRAVEANPGRTVAIAWAVLALGAYCVYQAYPLSMDEYAPYFQSNAFLAGRLSGQVPPDLMDWLVAPRFQESFLFVSHETGAVASGYWPGFALLLTPFMALGIPWLANPVIGALSLVAIYRLTRELLQSRTAAASALLLSLASAAFSINAMSFYSMPAHMLCNAVFVLLLLRPTPWRAFGAGLVGGLALVLHNPVPHLLFALPWLLWLLTRRDRWSLIARIGAGYLPWVGVGFAWHYFLGTMSSVHPGGEYGVGVGPLEAVFQSIAEVVAMPGQELVVVRIIGLSKVWLWAVPSLCVVAACGYWRQRGDAHFRLLLASTVLTLIGYLFVPVDQGHGWGFRYFHATWFVLPVFAASALVGRRPTDSAAADSAAVPVFAPAGFLHAATLGSMTLLTGYFAWQVHSFIARHLNQLPEATSGTPRVLIVDPQLGYYAYDLVQNDPFLRGTRLIALTQGHERDAKIMSRHFPGLIKLGGDYRGSVWGDPASSP